MTGAGKNNAWMVRGMISFWRESSEEICFEK